MLFMVTFNKEYFSTLTSLKARSDKTIPCRFRTNSGSRCIRQTANHFSKPFYSDYVVMTSWWRFYVPTFYGVNLKVVYPWNPLFLYNGTGDDKLLFPVNLTVLNLSMCLFRRKPYPTPFADQITKHLNIIIWDNVQPNNYITCPWFCRVPVVPWSSASRSMWRWNEERTDFLY